MMCVHTSFDITHAIYQLKSKEKQTTYDVASATNAMCIFYVKKLSSCRQTGPIWSSYLYKTFTSMDQAEKKALSM